MRRRSQPATSRPCAEAMRRARPFSFDASAGIIASASKGLPPLVSNFELSACVSADCTALIAPFRGQPLAILCLDHTNLVILRRVPVPRGSVERCDSEKLSSASSIAATTFTARSSATSLQTCRRKLHVCETAPMFPAARCATYVLGLNLSIFLTQFSCIHVRDASDTRIVGVY
jgi:hypothetical protein